MSNGSVSNNILQRDGTSQAQRKTAALQPEYIPVEERGLEDWLQFAQQFTKQLVFFDEHNEPSGTWERLLADGSTDGQQLIRDIVAYVENPEAFAGNKEKMQWLSRPHLVLFLSFLQLLDLLKQQFNGFTRKHLEFFYFDILGLRKKGPVPDLANVILRLADDVQQSFLPKGTALLAGKDDLDIDQVYITERDTVLSQAVIRSVKTFYTGKKTITLQQIAADGTLSADARLLNMLQLAFGTPGPGDALPLFNGGKVDAALLKNLAGRSTESSVVEYLTGKLFLPPATFKKILDTYTQVNGLTAIIPAIVQAYQNKLQQQQPTEGTGLPAGPSKEEWVNGFANPDAVANAFRSGGNLDATLCFNSLGKGHSAEEMPGTVPANLGFAIRSTHLLLLEGNRSITVTLSFANSNISMPEQGLNPFSILLSRTDVWQAVEPKSFLYGNLPVDKEGNAILNADSVAFTAIRTGQFNAIQVQIDLPETAPAITTPGEALASGSFPTTHPAILFLLKSTTGPSHYAWLRKLVLLQAAVQVKVAGLQLLKLQNDDSELNPKTPFEPFGTLPQVGSQLFLAHPEISSKPIQALTVQMEWMNKPANLSDYYAGYSDRTVSNASFKAALKAIDDRRVLTLKPDLRLFDDTPASVRHTETVSFATLPPQPAFPADVAATSWDRYFSLELIAPDFGHTAYPRLAAQVAYNNAAAVAAAAGDAEKTKNAYAKAVVLNQPYTPRLKQLSIGYASSFVVTPGSDVLVADNQFLHIMPFGYTAPDGASSVYLVPQLVAEGSLYIGLAHLVLPQTVSLLFQLAEGSANPDLEKPTINWSYLSNNKWLPLTGTNLIDDGTNGLLNSGIVELVLPEDATSSNTLLAGGLYWLQASAAANSDAIPDTISLQAGAVAVRFADQGNAATHYSSPLPPGRISETAVSIPEVVEVEQPFASFGGKAAEADAQFYRRVSERLRHKARAAALWDYEHLVLEQYPDIYKVKCIPCSDGSGAVDLVVIPDIKGKLPFNPFQPKAPAGLLNRIQQYLEQRSSSWATIRVINPTYRQVRVRVAVKIKEGYSESFFTARLNEDLIKYLAPWAYNPDADIFLDRRMDADVIINFIAEQFYIDYASDVYLYTKTGNEPFAAVKNENGENYVQALQPSEILVSAPAHDIDIIRKNYIADNFRGIGYMKIELDFKVG